MTVLDKQVYAMLIFLVNIKSRATDDSRGWVCRIDGFESDVDLRLARALTKTGLFEAKFRFSQQSAFAYSNNTANSSGFIGVWVALGEPNEPNDPLLFAIETFNGLSNARRFLFKDFEQQTIVGNVSCVLRHGANGTKFGYRLDALHSPLFYMRNVANFSQNKQYLYYIRTEDAYISIGFINPIQNAQTSSSYSFKFQRWHITALEILSHLIMFFISLYSPYILTFFDFNTNTPTENLSTAVKETDVFQSSESEVTESGKPVEHCTEYSEQPEANLPADGSISGLSRGCSIVIADETAVESSVNTQTTAEFVSRSHFNGKNSNQRYSGSDRVRNYNGGFTASGTEIAPSRYENDTNLTKAKPKKLVRVINIGDTATSVGFRSLIAEKVFTETKSKFLRSVKFVILLMVPLYPPIWVDLFVLTIPRCLSKSSPKWPSLTESAFYFIYTKHPSFLVFFICFVLRCYCLCFRQSSAHWVPSFLCRKHLGCFICNSYISKLLFPRRISSACDECKATADCPTKCEIPLNMRHNIGKQPEGIVKKNYKYVFSLLGSKFQSWLFLGVEAPSSSCTKENVIYGLGWVGLFILFVFLVVLDMIVSSPVVALCYGRVWFTINYFQNRFFQLLYLAIELVVICCSIIWVVYFSFCCSLSLEVVLDTFVLSCARYPVETSLTLAINILCWYMLWDSYSSFTNKYDNLDLMLLKVCLENHAKELDQYRKEGTVQIPEDLLSSTRKLVPWSKSVKLLLSGLLLRGVLIFLLLIIIQSVTVPDSKVLIAIVTFLTALLSKLPNILFTRKKQELKDALLKDKVERHVDSYFKGKLD